MSHARLATLATAAILSTVSISTLAADKLYTFENPTLRAVDVMYDSNSTQSYPIDKSSAEQFCKEKNPDYLLESGSFTNKGYGDIMLRYREGLWELMASIPTAIVPDMARLTSVTCKLHVEPQPVVEKKAFYYPQVKWYGVSRVSGLFYCRMNGYQNYLVSESLFKYHPPIYDPQVPKTYLSVYRGNWNNITLDGWNPELAEGENAYEITKLMCSRTVYK